MYMCMSSQTKRRTRSQLVSLAADVHGMYRMHDKYPSVWASAPSLSDCT